MTDDMGAQFRAKKHAVTLRDVARVAGVSHQTVSRVINHPEKVSPHTRDSVLKVIQLLNFRPSATARALTNRRSGMIGMIDSGSAIFGQALILDAVEGAAQRRGFSTQVTIVDDAASDGIDDAFTRLVERNAEGIVVLGNTVELAAAAENVGTEMPVTIVSSHHGPSRSIAHVGVDSYTAAQVAVDHLYAHGYRRIAHIAGPENWLDAKGRWDGWLAALHARGLPIIAPVIGNWLPRSGYQATQTLLRDAEFDAIFAANDHMALGALRALAEAGKNVPHDVGVIGFDDLVGADYFQPSLTTLRQPFEQIGEACMEQLLHQLGGEPSHDIHLQAVLEFRESTRRSSNRGNS